jgi:hypothetical protein
MFSKPILKQSGKQLLKQNYKKKMSLTIRTRREGLAQWKFKLKVLKEKISLVQKESLKCKRKIPTTLLTYIG